MRPSTQKMMNDITTKNTINEKIYLVRNVYVMLDDDLARIYGIETKVFNQAVKRNQERFPGSFRFQLTAEEYNALRSQFVTLKNASNRGQHRKYLPYVFTEQGVAMLSAVLKSKTAIDVSISIMESFVNLRKIKVDNALVLQRIETLEKQQIVTAGKVEQIFEAIENKNIKPQSGIFFDGQVFDAYAFVSDVIRQAKKSIILIDNYLDDTVLTQLSKANPKVRIYLLTKNPSHAFKLDLKKYNEQYANAVLIEFSLAHDRFLIVDQKDIYHIGASLKDLGKKWFAFSKLATNSFGLMEKINEVIEKNIKS